jgi:methionyl-tRNA formyltransferase
MNQKLNFAYFGLPLGALFLREHGLRADVLVLSPVEHIGRRRVARHWSPQNVLDALRVPEPELSSTIDAWFEQRSIDLLVSWYWTRLIPRRWLSQTRYGAVGAHPSLLPRHRGPNPFYWAIDSGDSETGVTIHRLTPEYDCGNLLMQKSVVIGERNAWQLARAIDRPSLSLLRNSVQRLGSDPSWVGTEQDERLATWAPEPTGEQLTVDWRWDVERILRRVRALAPDPGLALEIARVPFFVVGASAWHGPLPGGLQPGEATLLIFDRQQRVGIKTGSGAVQIDRAILGEAHADCGRELLGDELARLVYPTM